MQLKMMSLKVVPEHLKKIKVIAAERGLRSSAMIRLLMAQEIRRDARQKKAEHRQ